MIRLSKTILYSLSAWFLIACGSSEKKLDPPEYFYAREGRPLAVTAPQGIALPDLSSALVIPDVSRPLGEYNPKLIEPPNAIGILGDEVDRKIEEEQDE